VPGPELERFVVEQIKAIGRDSELVADVLNESRRQREESLGKLEIERRTLEREIGCYAADIRKLAGQDGVATDRLADIQDRLGTAERRVTEIDDQMVALSRGLVGVGEVTDACTQFDPLWETLTAKEQARLLNLLVQRVDFDGQGGTVSITFHPSGIKTLAQEQKEQETTV
jgi:site-specific DNA recombinase